MNSKKLTLVLVAFLSFFSCAEAQSVNPKKNYFGNGLTSRFESMKQTELKGYEFAEVLNSAELLAKRTNDNYDCKVFYCYNGPSDPELDYCNNAANYYISNGTYDLPNDFRLFKVGPFYLVEKATLSPGSKKETYLLTIQHKYDEEKYTTEYLIGFDSVTLLRRK
ncbi:MAG: hypothetical protein K0S09_1895 [Sphingobacteriaceae bacterium]|jgi:hypothetical protein|nr:hypothetical protein [Sphingobacteriaceae bacterium]